FYRIERRQTVDTIAADTDTSWLAVAARSQLPDCLVSECSRARDHANIAWLVNVAGHDPNLASTRCDNPWAIRPDQPRFFTVDERFDAHHVHHRYSFRDANDQLNAGIDRFEN